jgi:electron transfer flavoprotein alpha subunit
VAAEQSTTMKTEADPPAASLARGVWVVGDIRAPAQRRATRWLLQKASLLATKRGVPLSLMLLGKGVERHLAEFRGDELHQVSFVDHPRLAVYRQETFTGVLESLVREGRPEIVLFLANDCGRELAPRLAARLGTGLCADCVDLDIEPDTGFLLQTVPAFGDNVYARIVTPEQRPQMATVRPAVLPESREASPAGGSPRTVRVPFPAGLPRDRVKWLGAEKETASGEALEEARTLVCGGRGMGSGKAFQTLWTLARLLGAEVGGTRPAVQAQWIEEDCMVGQTGRAVAPELLLLFGISGATQFTASIQQSRYIVAVNRDPRAAVFCGADLGIVGDVRQILPELIRRLQETLVTRYGRLPEEIYAEGRRPQGGALGPRLRALRQKRGYRLEEAARALEVSPLGLERIEKDEEAPSVSFLLRASQLFRVDPAPFLSQAEGARADRKREESFLKRTQSYSYRTLTPGAERKHLRAFRVAIDPGRDHRMVEYRHEGEEFVLVLRGEVEVKVGEDIQTLREGDSLHFDGSIPHHLRNPSGEKADLVVVLYTP